MEERIGLNDPLDSLDPSRFEEHSGQPSSSASHDLEHLNRMREQFHVYVIWRHLSRKFGLQRPTKGGNDES